MRRNLSLSVWIGALACFLASWCPGPCCGLSDRSLQKGVSEDTFDNYLDLDTNETHVVRRFTLQNDAGMKVQVLNYGAIIHSISVPDKDGNLLDVALGFGDMNGYLSVYGRNPYFGATIGRVANRISNAKFELDGIEYQLAANNGVNHLHGGVRGFDKRIWAHTVEQTPPRVTFKYVSPDGQEGYPGEISAQIVFELTSRNELKLNYQATTTKRTPVSMTNHNYFNLNGHKKADQKLKGHFVQLNADKYTPVNDLLIPTGEIKNVQGSVYDLRTRKNLYDLLQSFPAGPNGYDVNFCVNQEPGVEMNLVGRMESDDSGIALEVYSDQPGVQFYTSNLVADPDNNDPPLPGKDGAVYYKHGAFCMETQKYPNAINEPNFPSPILSPGETYKHATVFKFTTSATSSSSSLAYNSILIALVLLIVSCAKSC